MLQIPSRAAAGFSGATRRGAPAWSSANRRTATAPFLRTTGGGRPRPMASAEHVARRGGRRIVEGRMLAHGPPPRRPRPAARRTCDGQRPGPRPPPASPLSPSISISMMLRARSGHTHACACVAPSDLGRRALEYLERAAPGRPAGRQQGGGPVRTRRRRT